MKLQEQQICLYTDDNTLRVQTRVVFDTHLLVTASGLDTGEKGYIVMMRLLM
jgi:hypothetical protein